MLANMPQRIFEDWMIFYQDEPFGQIPLRLGYAAAGLGNLLGKPKGRRAWKPEQFMPDVPRRKSTSRPDRQLGKIFAIAKMFGATINDPKGVLKRYG
jgi:hypothetical protein